MENTKHDSFRLHLPGLLKVLAEHLYSQRQVAVRELIQNAHDSCTRRRLTVSETGYQPRIDIGTDTTLRTFTISDNGCGLTESEITDYLATIGRSYTRETRERLGFLSPDKATELIGQFGFGFLSAFLVAAEVSLQTLSVLPDAVPLHWKASGGEDYVIEPGTRTATGTTITLTLKPEASFLLHGPRLRDMIAQFADFLPLPIYLNGAEQPVNLGRAPWETSDTRTATTEFIERAFQTSDALAVIPLRSHTVPVGAGGESVPVTLNGFLFVPPGSVASLREYGDMTVYIRRMFIRSGEKHLLPPWARFVRGVIDCPDLQPTASREDVHQDAAFEACQRAIEEQLSSGLKRIAEREPEVWHQIVTGHTDVITGWAARDNEFFEQVADIIPVRTSRGLRSLPDYLRETDDDTLYYVTRELGSLQERLLAEGYGVPVIDGSWFGTVPLLERYAASRRSPLSRQRLRLVRLDGESERLLRPISDDRPFYTLLDYFDRRGIAVKVAAFAPATIPAVLLHGDDAEFLRDGQQVADTAEPDDPLAKLIGGYVSEQIAVRGGVATLSGILYLNADNTLITTLAAMGNESNAERDATLTTIYAVARLFAGRMLSTSDAGRTFGEMTDALKTLSVKKGQ